jgi:phage FluMu protein Com
MSHQPAFASQTMAPEPCSDTERKAMRGDRQMGESKRCCHCHKWLPRAGFALDVSRVDGRCNRCSTCQTARWAAWDAKRGRT